MAARKKRRRRMGGPVARRWFALGALVLVGLLYYRPLHDYFDARSQQAAQLTAVQKLQREQAALEKRLRHASSDAALAAEARTLGYVLPGEHLFIVKDIPQWWRRHHAARRGHRR
jgi:cell division protein FtsB